jgi:hypothetical protein
MIWGLQVPALEWPNSGSVLRILVLLIDGKRSRCGVVENEIHYQVIEIGSMEENDILDLLDMPVKKVHRLIHVPEFEAGTRRHIDLESHRSQTPSLDSGSQRRFAVMARRARS